MKNRFDLSELYTRFIQLFEISGIEDVFDDDHDDDHVPYGEKMVIRVTPEKTLSCNVLSERLTIDLYADTPDGVVGLHDQSAPLTRGSGGQLIFEAEDFLHTHLGELDWGFNEEGWESLKRQEGEVHSWTELSTEWGVEISYGSDILFLAPNALTVEGVEVKSVEWLKDSLLWGNEREEVIRKKMMMVEEALRCPHTFSDSRELASLLTKSIPWAGVGSVQFETDRGYCSLHWPHEWDWGRETYIDNAYGDDRAAELAFGFYEVHYRYKWLRDGRFHLKPPVAAEKCVSLLLTLLTKASFEEAKRTADDYIQQEGLTADWEERVLEVERCGAEPVDLRHFNAYDWGIVVDLFDLYGVEKNGNAPCKLRMGDGCECNVSVKREQLAVDFLAKTADGDAIWLYNEPIPLTEDGQGTPCIDVEKFLREKLGCNVRLEAARYPECIKDTDRFPRSCTQFATEWGAAAFNEYNNSGTVYFAPGALCISGKDVYSIYAFYGEHCKADWEKWDDATGVRSLAWKLLKCPHELNREDAGSWIASLGLGDHCLRNHLEQLEIEVGTYRCTLTRDGSRSVYMEYKDLESWEAVCCDILLEKLRGVELWIKTVFRILAGASIESARTEIAKLSLLGCVNNIE